MKRIYAMIFALFTIIAFGQQNLVLNGTGDDHGTGSDTSNTSDNAAVNISSSDEINSVEVYDLAGKKVSTLNDVSNFIDVSHFNKGVYLMEFQLQKGQVTKKLIIE